MTFPMLRKDNKQRTKITVLQQLLYTSIVCTAIHKYALKIESFPEGWINVQNCQIRVETKNVKLF